MKYHCCDRLRRNAVAVHPTLNGMDYLEVLDRDLPELHEFRQRTLFLHFLKPIAGLNELNLRLDGGDRIRNVQIEWAAPGVPAPVALTSEEAALLAALPDQDQVLVVRTDSSGDRSIYRLQLMRAPDDEHVPDGFDPVLAEIEFSFKVECESDFDCKPLHLCPPEQAPPPEINYLAKDYASFRRLLLDRLAQLLPGWKDRPAADTGVALAELLAYVGDHLSYRQDAAATEAYLGTARKRISLRRHALLVDYAMHDGCNARTSIQLEVDAVAATLPVADTQFLTECPGLPPQLAPGSGDAERALRLHPEVFEPMHAITLRLEHNALPFYTWGDRRCCLAQGATRATLQGHFSHLEPGDLVLFEELLGPTTGVAADADPQHRQVVRLVQVEHTEIHPINGAQPLTDPLTGVEVTEIVWAKDDALTFPLCLSSVTDEDHGGIFLDQVSIARGNVLLADHGRSLAAEPIGTVPAPRLLYAPLFAGDRCEPEAPLPVPVRFRPQLAQRPLTQADRVSFEPEVSASQMLQSMLGSAVPQIELTVTLDPDPPVTWLPKRNLLNSAADADEFVVEVDDDGGTLLRFGDDRNGRRPEPESVFAADYRVGNGVAGNLGAESIRHVITATAGILQVRNPLPARGGVDPETIESVRRRAPEAFRRQERAVTEADYAEVSTRHTDVANAAATLRWTGSWHTMFITADREGGDALTSEFTGSLQRHLDRYRMAGHDLEFHEPLYVSLELALHVCVKPDHFRSDVRRALGELFSNRVLRDGRRGLFHPDNFSFGQPVYLSRLYAAAHAVPGVLSAQITAFRRQGSDDVLALEEGQIVLGRLEIARLDNDANYPERGVLRLELHGGK